MPSTDIVTTLFSHHLWANLCLLQRCAQLTPEQMDARNAGSYGSIIETWRHIVTSEQFYFSRINAELPPRRAENAPPLTIAEMADSLRTTGSGLIEWAPKVQAEDTVQIKWEGEPRAFPKTVILTEIINHATEHREQIKAIMTELGIEPPNLNGRAYFVEAEK